MSLCVAREETREREMLIDHHNIGNIESFVSSLTQKKKKTFFEQSLLWLLIPLQLPYFYGRNPMHVHQRAINHTSNNKISPPALHKKKRKLSSCKAFSGYYSTCNSTLHFKQNIILNITFLKSKDQSKDEHYTTSIVWI